MGTLEPFNLKTSFHFFVFEIWTEEDFGPLAFLKN